jgi:hypothetical protein
VRFASLSRRLVRHDLLGLRREHIFGRLEIEAGLNVHPERGAGFEEFAEPERGVGRNGLFFARDAFDPGARLSFRRATLARFAGKPFGALRPSRITSANFPLKLRITSNT